MSEYGARRAAIRAAVVERYGETEVLPYGAVNALVAATGGARSDVWMTVRLMGRRFSQRREDHGRAGCYVHNGCRRPECVAAKSESDRRWYERAYGPKARSA